MTTAVATKVTVTIYTNPGCMPCRLTKRDLGKHKIKYKEIDVSKDQNAVNRLRKLGYTTVPVVIVEEEGETDIQWSGFSPDNIAKLKRHIEDNL